MAIINPMFVILCLSILLLLPATTRAVTTKNFPVFRLNIGGPQLPSPKPFTSETSLPKSLSPLNTNTLNTSIYTIPNLSNSSVFYSHRYAHNQYPLRYRLPIPVIIVNKVRLYFGEIREDDMKKGSRIMDVGINGVWKKNFDIWGIVEGYKGDRNKSVRSGQVVLEWRDFMVDDIYIRKAGKKDVEFLRRNLKRKVGFGKKLFLDIEIRSKKGNAMLSGIEVFMGKKKRLRKEKEKMNRVITFGMAKEGGLDKDMIMIDKMNGSVEENQNIMPQVTGEGARNVSSEPDADATPEESGLSQPVPSSTPEVEQHLENDHDAGNSASTPSIITPMVNPSSYGKNPNTKPQPHPQSNKPVHETESPNVTGPVMTIEVTTSVEKEDNKDISPEASGGATETPTSEDENKEEESILPAPTPQVRGDEDFVEESAEPSISMVEPEATESEATATEPLTESPSEKDFALNSGKDHRAHAVPGGPYVTVDLDGSGEEQVTLNGQLSHSHYFTSKKVGLITKYDWSDKKTGKLLGTGPNPKITFKVGITTVQLKVTDNTGDVAIDYTTVTVKKSTAEGVLCYYYKGHTDLEMSVNSDPRPVYSAVTPTIEFKNFAAFPPFDFPGEEFTVRCVFRSEIEKEGKFSYSISHTGPLKVYADQEIVADVNSTAPTTTETEAKSYTASVHSWQVMYKGGKTASLTVADLSPAYDSGNVLPIITKLSETKSLPSGGGKVDITGLGLVNGIMIFFGGKKAKNVISASEKVITVEVPPGKGKIGVFVTNKVGKSNEIEFEYTSKGAKVPVKFKQTSLKKKGGSGPYELSQITTLTYGPDGRLYIGSVDGFIRALTVDKDLQVVDACKSKQVQENRAVMGLAFNPADKEVKLYVSTSILEFKNKKLLGHEGWTNGKIITMKPKDDECVVPIEDFVTGLPVSNHDHGVNAIQFLKNGKMLVAVGGFTNAGVSLSDDKVGGLPAVPLSGAVIVCDTDKGADFDGKITYDNVHDLAASKQTGGDCRVWAAGLRNAFGMTITSNGNVYCLDNGANFGFGEVSTGCKTNGPSFNAKDKLHLLSRGQNGGGDAPYFGFPNRNRGRFDEKQCIYEGPGSVAPLAELKSSTNGIVEYTANTFNSQLKGHLFLSQLAGQSPGNLSHVQLKSDGTLVAPPEPFGNVSGISVVQGPYGELIFAQVYKGQFPVLQPDYQPPTTTTLIAVTPNRGPQTGGLQVLVTGHNFGSKPTVMFGNLPCTDITNVAKDGTSLICTVPAGKGAVSVVVTGAKGKSTPSGTDFEYY